VISRRILPLVMVLTIALCPVALDVCQAACAEHERGAVATSASAEHHHHAGKTDAMAVHHHGHDASPVTTVSDASTAGTASRIPAYAAGTSGTASRVPAYAGGTASRIPAYARGGAPHGCLHGEDLPAFVGTNLQIALTPAAVAPTLFELPGLTPGTRRFVDTDSEVHSPHLTLTTQLRV
jgi:hypothetical protein